MALLLPSLGPFLLTTHLFPLPIMSGRVYCSGLPAVDVLPKIGMNSVYQLRHTGANVSDHPDHAFDLGKHGSRWLPRAGYDLHDEIIILALRPSAYT